MSLRAVFKCYLYAYYWGVILSITAPILNTLHTISTLLTHDVTNHFEAFCVVLPMHQSIAFMMAVTILLAFVIFSMWCCSRPGGNRSSSDAAGSIYGMRERSRSQIMVMMCWNLIGLPVAWVGPFWVHRIERLIVVANSYSIVDSESGRAGTMVRLSRVDRSKKR